MPRSDRQKMKLLYLMKILFENTDESHGMSMQEIIDALEKEEIKAERKSIYSDVALLTEYGYDIVCEKEGKNYKYKMISRDFELPELKLLVDAVQSSKFITERKSKELIGKIESLASKYDASSLNRQVYVANRIKTTNESVYYNVDDIHSAIAGNSKIAFKYFQWNEKKEKIFRHDGKIYTISPWALTWDDENYYMVGYDSETDTIKHYRVDKMVKIKVLDEKREGKEHFKSLDMALYSRKVFGMFGGQEETVTLICKNSMAGVIFDRFGTDVSTSPADDGYFKVRVSVQVSPQFYGWVFSMGDGIKIQGPDSVIKGMKDSLKQVAKDYK